MIKDKRQHGEDSVFTSDSPADSSADRSADFMAETLQLASQAMAEGEVPVGAIITHHHTGAIIARAYNLVERDQDCTAHAEMLAITQAQHYLGTKSLADCDLWVSLEPCAMCAGAIAHARIRRLYYGAEDKKGGAVDNGVHLFNQPTTHHKPEIYGGLSAEQSAQLLTSFFKAKR